MGKDKFKKRKERKRLIRAKMLELDIKVTKVAASLRHTSGKSYTIQAIYKGMDSSPTVIAALIAAGVPERMFKHAPSPQPSPQGEGVKDHRQDACATGGA